MNTEIFGLKEKIARATSDQEIAKLLTIGNTYKFASARTRASWKNVGFKVLENLKNTSLPKKEMSDIKPTKSKKTPK
jgi:hypothetical protein